MESKIYIGDAVYVERKEFGDIALTTENGVTATNTVIIAPEVLQNLLAVLKRWAEKHSVQR
jgi:hypothetical protein